MEEKQITIDNLNTNYKQIGDGDIPIILLHGWGINSDKYIETAKELARFTIYDLRFTIYIPDVPGFGKSDNPCLPDRQAPEAWGVDEYVKFTKRFIEVAISHSERSEESLANAREAHIRAGSFGPRPQDDKVVLIGHSFGGRIAIKFAAKYPEKLKALILTGAAGIKHPPSLKQKIFYALAKAGKMFFSLPILNYLQKPAQKLLYKVAREKDYYQAEGVMKQTFKKVVDEDLAPCLEKISAHGGSASGGKTPTLLVWGAKDKSTPLNDGKIMHFKIQNSKFKILSDADHRLPYQYPQEFAKIIVEFIRNTNA